MTTDFLNVPQSEFQTSLGVVELPILYEDASQLSAFFWADYDAACALLADTGVVPHKSPHGKAFAALSFFEYRKTSIGSYNEVGLAIGCYPEQLRRAPNMMLELVKKAERWKGGFHIVDLPVTTEEAFTAGRELWGYPKFVTKLPIQFGPRLFSGKVLDPDDANTAICSLEGSLGMGVTVPSIDLVLFSKRDRDVLKTIITIDASMKTMLGRGFRLSVGSSKHRMAGNLLSLGLDGAAPLLVQNSVSFQSRLPAGEIQR